MFVMAPPIATSASTGGRPSRRARSAEIAARRRLEGRIVHRTGQAESLRVAHRADVHAEALVHPVPMAERELRAPAARVEHRQGALSQPDAGLDREIRQAALLLARDDLDPDAGPVRDRGDDGVPVPGDTEGRGADGGDGQRAVRRRVGRHGRDRVGRPRGGGGGDLAALCEALAEAGDVGTVADGDPSAVPGALRDEELDRVGPDIDDGVARRCAGVARVFVAKRAPSVVAASSPRVDGGRLPHEG